MNLRWIGGKMNAARDLLSLAPSSFDEYREPFAGNASMLWVVAPGKQRWINDLDADLIRYHRSMQDPSNDLIDQVRAMSGQIKSADDLRRMWNLAKIEWYFYNSVPHYIFVNRFAFGQICRRSRRGLCSYSFKYKTNGLSVLSRERMEESRRIYQGVTITEGDYSDLLDAPGEDVFILCDPPYYLGDIDHAGRIYEHDFSLEDHVVLRDRLRACKHRFLLTISLCSLTHRLYVKESDFNIYTRGYFYSATNAMRREDAYELVVTNY